MSKEIREEVTAKSYTLRTEDRLWLGQIVLTSDGSFMSVTDYGNFSFSWRHHGSDDFRQFLIGLDKGYFAGKMYQGMSYVAYGKKIEASANRFAEKILPALQDALKKEIESESISPIH